MNARGRDGAWVESCVVEVAAVAVVEVGHCGFDNHDRGSVCLRLGGERLLVVGELSLIWGLVSLNVRATLAAPKPDSVVVGGGGVLAVALPRMALSFSVKPQSCSVRACTGLAEI